MIGWSEEWVGGWMDVTVSSEVYGCLSLLSVAVRRRPSMAFLHVSVHFRPPTSSYTSKHTHTQTHVLSNTHTLTLASSFVLAFIWVLLHMDKCSPQYGRQSVPAFMDTKGRENQEWKKLGQLGPGAHPACLILLMVWDKAACDRECVCAHLHVCFCLDRKQTSSYFCYDFQQCSQRPDI